MDGAQHTTLRCSGVHRGTGGMNIHNPQTGESRASRDASEKYQTQTETHHRELGTKWTAQMPKTGF